MSKIKNVEANHTRDLARLAATHLNVVSCPGGRPINRGYVCPHCGMDTSHGDCDGVVGFVNRRAEREPA